MNTVSKNPTEIAKIIRKELKSVFPGVKFSVRTSYFSMGNAIDISWVDGPSNEMVESVVDKWQSGRFDGMTDYAYSVKAGAVVDGVLVYSSAKYVSTHREYSENVERNHKNDYSVNPVFFEKAHKVPSSLNTDKESDEKKMEVYPVEKTMPAEELTKEDIRLVHMIANLYRKGEIRKAYMVSLNMSIDHGFAMDDFKEYLDMISAIR